MPQRKPSGVHSADTDAPARPTSVAPVIPRLLVTDAAGQRSIPIDRPIVSLGRRSEREVCVMDVGVSRLHAEIHAETDGWRLKDCGSRAGTFVNGVRKDEHVLAHGDRIRLGQMQSTTITFVVGDQLPSVERSAITAARELRHMAALLEGLRALGAGRVLDEVLTLVLDAAIDVTGAERGFIMLANRAKVLEFKVARGRGQLMLSGETFATSRKIPEAVFATGRLAVFEDLLDEAMAPDHAGTVALGIRHVICAPLRRGALCRTGRGCVTGSGSDRRAVSGQPGARQPGLAVDAISARHPDD